MPKSQGADGTGDRDGVLLKVRLDFKGTGKPGRFLFGGKPTDRLAEEAREQQAAVFRNVPIQGIQIMDIDASADVYTVYDDLANNDTAYAPLVLTVKADSLENVVRFIARDDFRKIEILDPAFLTLNHSDIERLLFKVYEEMKEFRQKLEKKYNLSR
ncbi:hypothetical protein [Pelotomaculum propionicicum]|uniref:Uncharacterized protein n=1 Tax=Pelotomaculum propionicicum TaxID=258475 RepID=A0A4Y7RS60_9FIRM|nr:hypothetical protein [Pelotomaculum propionicicum]TEB11835.1 hypothetical protein Pmgp_01413 [Pelotomaculum propionicicum]